MYNAQSTIMVEEGSKKVNKKAKRSKKDPYSWKRKWTAQFEKDLKEVERVSRSYIEYLDTAKTERKPFYTGLTSSLKVVSRNTLTRSGESPDRVKVFTRSTAIVNLSQGSLGIPRSPTV